MPCRLTRQRTWMHRILLEGLCHADNAFVTCTYAATEDGGPWSLRPVDLQAWIKRLRRRFAPARLRFFAVGEYGDRFRRPHYHAALFGYPSCRGGPVCEGVCQCRPCLDVRETWTFGHVFVGRLEPKSARYIARYTLKKMTSSADTRLFGRYPEFARMSRRPGIGVDAMWDVASVVLQYPRLLPTALLHGGRPLPLGRHLTSKLSEMTGLEKPHFSTGDALCLLRSFAAANNRSVSSVFQELNGPLDARLAAKLSPELPLSTAQILKSLA